MTTAVSLFSGCGGSDTGIHQLGINILMANDIIPYARDVYLANLPDTDYILKDIQKLESFPSADLLLGCYPCQGFSQGGLRQADNKLNFLYKEFARALKSIKPKAFIVENVNGMLRSNYEYLLKDQINTFSELSYDVHHKVLNAADYGVPQFRKRIFIVGTRKDLAVEYKFPIPTHGPNGNLPYVTIREALHGMPDWPTGEFYNLPFHWYYMSRNRRQDWEQPSKTIVSNARHTLLHPISPKMKKIGKDQWIFVEDRPARRFSYQECAILQGFKRDLIFPDTSNASLMNKYKVIGNAVPPALFQAVANELIKFL
ncbi:DNA cytosine methyltransferase [Neisseria zoodegmatis]|uniref:Cytosine-specific methyltransferase n=1 Tax=Neisseria zoodegmatis TaxID=326523 RepID=A0AB38DPK0_9NEIS|nr:DNA cytosine methyltransferase [Neisseria zoodegmatis]OSI09445.1 DNA (cytosine-5-)-methyltransferase [Neisseria zoodegmatis]SNU79273.1 DcmB [Neisseria zoodegmatis]